MFQSILGLGFKQLVFPFGCLLLGVVLSMMSVMIEDFCGKCLARKRSKPLTIITSHDIFARVSTMINESETKDLKSLYTYLENYRPPR